MDRRIKYTKKIIKDTLIDLLNKKDINKITVSEICKIADINRATFYRYYLDVYDLLEQIKQEFVTELKEAAKKDTQNDNIYTFLKDLLEVLVNNKELGKVLFNTKNSTYFLNDILELAYEKCKNRWKKDLPNIKEEDIEYATIFIFNGTLGIINYWVQNDFDKSVEEMEAIIEKLCYFGTHKYIYNKKIDKK